METLIESLSHCIKHQLISGGATVRDIEELAIERYKQRAEKEARVEEIRQALMWCERSPNANPACQLLAEEVRRLAGKYEQEFFIEPNK